MAPMEDVKGFTPGPWYVLHTDERTDSPMVYGNEEFSGPICRVVTTDSDANLRLILQAPSLLHQVSVLKEALRKVDLYATDIITFGNTMNGISNEEARKIGSFLKYIARTALSAQGEKT